MGNPLAALASYFTSLTQPQAPVAGPPSPGAAPAAGQPGGAAGPSTLSNLGTDATSFLGNPLTQAALSGYFSAAGSPRLAGWGGRISSGGLGALGGFNAAESNQLKEQQEQLELQKAQAEAAQTAQQQKVFSGLTPQQQQVATYPGLASFQDKAAIQLNNKNAVAAFQAQYPNDPKAAAFSASYVDSPKAVSPGDIDADYQAHLQAPGKLTQQTADITEKNAETKRDLAAAQRLQTQPAAGQTANWYNPTTRQYYRGAQKAPTDIPASVEQSQAGLKTRAAWQKEYDNAKQKYITEHTVTGFMGGKTMPNEADVDAYARSQADAIYGPLDTIGTASTSAADEAEAPPPLPEGSTSYAVDADGNVGHVDASGKFVPF
jgi:hypothetical protein